MCDILNFKVCNKEKMHDNLFFIFYQNLQRYFTNVEL